ncbi:alkylation response protein AidB-like acyl-CoA dehydrogenase [Streptomyces sp. SAI-170]|uniref:acyl-CoA dehydrogenase family protein n=1 Tax=Streptomyces sp. SAI-170 TaxID=3377729 RepID=UPI003C7984D2
MPKFLLDTEQRAFADSLGALLKTADTPSVVRDWSRGEPTSGRALWRRIAEAGVCALAVPEAYGGLGRRPVELAVAFVELGRYAVPGPLVETVTAAALLSDAATESRPEGRPPQPHALLPALLDGTSLATLAPENSLALDGDTADIRLTLTPDGLRLSPGHGPVRPSLDPARRRTPLSPGGELLATRPNAALARLTTAAQALGVGEALLDRTVAYVRERTQFGVPIGSFQALKHRLADAGLALEFARPLLFGAALTMSDADIAAAKVNACEAAYTTARTALQCHGAIGYTAEYDLSLWLAKARALRTAWGDPDTCRAELLVARESGATT